MRRGARVAAGRARNPASAANDGWQTQRVSGGRQAWPQAIVASPPTERNAAMSMREDAWRPMRSTYQPPPVAGPSGYAPAATNAPSRQTAAMRGQGAVRPPNCQMYPRMTAAVDGGLCSSAREATLAAQVVDIKRKARDEHDHAMKLINESKAKVLACRQRAAEAERKLMLVQDELAQEKMASDALNAIMRDKSAQLAIEQERAKGLKTLVDSLLKEKADSNAWADEPTRGKEALALLYPDGGAVGPPRQAEMQARCPPGLLRKIFLEYKTHDCACRHELAVNGLTNPRLRFQDITTLGQGGFGTVYRGRCNKTRKEYAIKTAKPGNSGACLRREMIAFTLLGKHDNIINIECLSDVVGSEGLIMEMAVCDMLSATTGTCSTSFSVSQQLSFEADATLGLHYMHTVGFIHCDVKLENTLICRSGGPTRFVGKVTDPGLWCGLGEMRTTRTGTWGWTPLENVHTAVAAAPNQDAFSVAVDVCFILANPVLKNEDASMWSHTKLMTLEERERLRVLRAEGGDVRQLQMEVTERTMSDGSMSRIFLQPGNLNSALPPSKLRKTCEVLGKTVSRNPMDRLSMPALTAFLRDLAGETAAYENTLAVVPPGFGLPPGLAPRLSFAPPPGLAAPPGLASPLSLAPPPGLELPPPAMPFIVDGGDHGEDFIPSGDGTMDRDSTIVHASGLPAAELVRADGGSDGNAPGGLAPEGHFSHLSLEGQPEAQDLPSTEWVHLAPPLLAEPHASGEDVGASAAMPLAEVFETPHGSALHVESGTDGAGAAVPPAEAAEAPRGSSPIRSAPHFEEIIDSAVIPSVADTAGRVNPLTPPLPGSTARGLANRLTGMLRSLGGMFWPENAPSPVAPVRLVGQANRGGGSGCGGEEGFGIGHVEEEVEMDVVDGPDTPLAFGTSAPADDVDTPPAAVPRPRVVDGPDTPLAFAQGLTHDFGASTHAADAATPPAAPPAELSGPS